MTADVVAFEGKVPAKRLANRLGGAEANDDLSAGVSGGFSVLSFRGSKWRIKHGGEETPIVNGEGDPISTLRVLVLKGNKAISKNFYEGAYEEGSNDKPSCFSVDGIKPDAGVDNPVSATCAACPNAVFGSRITPAGKKAKACSDSRRLAVIPEGDLPNDTYGGPMLLRVPAASLSELAVYAKRMKAKGFPYNTVVTKIGFDMDAAYPKLTFNAARPLGEDEETEVIGLLDTPEFSDKIEMILATAIEMVPAEEPEVEEEEDDPFDDEPVAKAPVKKKAAVKKKAVAKKKVAAKPKVEPKPETEGEDELDDELDDILASLDNLD